MCACQCQLTTNIKASLITTPLSFHSGWRLALLILSLNTAFNVYLIPENIYDFPSTGSGTLSYEIHKRNGELHETPFPWMARRIPIINNIAQICNKCICTSCLSQCTGFGYSLPTTPQAGMPLWVWAIVIYSSLFQKFRPSGEYNSSFLNLSEDSILICPEFTDNEGTTVLSHIMNNCFKMHPLLLV